MKVKSFVFNAFFENTYLISNDQGETFIIDPGCYETYEQNQLTDYIEKNHLKPVAIINTHCHVDHVLGNAFLQRFYQIPLWIPEGEVDLLRAVTVYAPQYGLARYEPAVPDNTLPTTGSIQLGDISLEIIFAPGHAPGHIMLYHAESQQLIAGDVIFSESIGRTDLPGGDYPTLEKSIKEGVYTLPDTTTIYPGHGPSTKVGHEKKYNPFVRA